MQSKFAGWDATMFRVWGYFAFLVPEGTEVSEKLMKESVLLMDSRFPWRPLSNDEHSGPSIHEYSEFEKKIQDKNWDCYTMVIRPSAALNHNELSAYYEYVMNLAHQLFMQGLPSVQTVRAWVHFESLWAKFTN
jgi:hypothetical protein